MASRAVVASLLAACGVLAACRGGVKAGLRAAEAPAGPPSLAPPAVRPQVWRIEYYKISDG